MERKLFDWSPSKTAGKTTEVAVLAPIRLGCVAGERRTYEERAMAVIGNFASRVEQGLPNELNLVPSIHFGRIMLLRPEHYLLGSAIPGVQYEAAAETTALGPGFSVTKPIDEYVEVDPNMASKDPPDLQLRSFLLTTVEFDGDLRAYFRDIGVQLAERFDAIFENCEDYPGTSDFEAFWLWIRRFQIRTQLFYAACPDLSVVRIKQLAAFRRSFDLLVARVRGPATLPPGALDALFDEFLKENLQHGEGFPFPSGLFHGAQAEAGA
ncbi:hypothetical protein [Phenylobacterium sp.]|uniref:hypothetical protein n=1 Tax=Phenylobacterium sp. TaxID=1871053 RepID=UPI0035AFD1E2